MRRSWIASALMASSVTLGVSGSAQAYCLTRTCDVGTGTCDIVDGCNMSGKVLYWPNSCVSFDVQKDGSPLLKIDYNTVHDVAKKAFQQWLNADCGNGTHPGISVADFGAIDCAKPEYNKTQPNANVITFHDSKWTYTNTVDTVALTTVFFNGESGEIYDSNIEINSFAFDLTAGNPVGEQLDLNAVLTHEAGHFLGLSHSSVAAATMYQSYNPDMATLDPDDEKGICLSLPTARSVVSSDCTPRHGFSGQCGSPETGCCATAVGQNPSGHEQLGLFGLALGACAWGARRLRAKREARTTRSAPRR